MSNCLLLCNVTLLAAQGCRPGCVQAVPSLADLERVLRGICSAALRGAGSASNQKVRNVICWIVSGSRPFGVLALVDGKGKLTQTCEACRPGPSLTTTHLRYLKFRTRIEAVLLLTVGAVHCRSIASLCFGRLWFQTLNKPQ